MPKKKNKLFLTSHLTLASENKNKQNNDGGDDKDDFSCLRRFVLLHFDDRVLGPLEKKIFEQIRFGSGIVTCTFFDPLLLHMAKLF